MIGILTCCLIAAVPFAAAQNPQLSYASYFGGNAQDTPTAVTTDANGNLYVAGYTYSTDFPTTPGAYSATGIGYVTKFSPQNDIVFSTRIPGLYAIGGIAVDASGNVYVAGAADPATFQTTAGAFQTSSSAQNGSAGILKLSSDGSHVLYATFLGGSFQTGASDIAVDGSGNAYVTGDTADQDFPTTPGAYKTTLSQVRCTSGDGHTDCDTVAYVAKLNPTGSALVYASYLGDETFPTTHFDSISTEGIRVDSSGNAYIAGQWGMQATPGAISTTDPYDGWVVKMNPSGSALVYAATFGGGAPTFHGLDIDSAGNVYLAGTTGTPGGSTFTTVNADQPTAGGSGDAFVMKLNSTGSARVFATYLGGSAAEHGGALTLDKQGNILVSGYTYSTDFPTMHPVQSSNAGQSDAFLARYSNDGHKEFATYLGGSSSEGYQSVVGAAGTSGILVFDTASTDMATTSDARYPQYRGGYYDDFIAKIDLSGVQAPCAAPSSQGINICSPAASSSVTSPVTVNAAFTLPGTPYRFELWNADTGEKLASVRDSNVMNTDVTLPEGSHTLTLVAHDTSGNRVEKSVSFSVTAGGATGACSEPTSDGVHVCSPAEGSTVDTTFHVSATFHLPGTPYRFELWDASAGVKLATERDQNTMEEDVTLSAGDHTLAFVAKDTLGNRQETDVHVTVSSTGACTAPATSGVNVCSPQNGATVGTTFDVQAYAKVSGGVYRFELWANGTKVVTVRDSGVMNTSVTLPAGSYLLEFVARNADGSDRQVKDVSINVR